MVEFEDRLQKAEEAAIQWLIVCFEKSNSTGFAHSRINYLPEFLAWRKAYPETSGYLIENFLEFNHCDKFDTRDLAFKVADWLCLIQDQAGYYSSGVKGNKASFFNTAQVLFGLKKAFDYTDEAKYKNALQRSLNWLLSSLDADGMCTKGLYVEGNYAAYYSRALWPMLLCSSEIQRTSLIQAIQLLFNKQKTLSGFEGMGFFPGKDSITHTIAYTWEGFFECGQILDDPKILDHCIQMSYRFVEIIKRDKKLFAEYTTDWNPSKTYQCVVGQAQFIANFCKAYQYSKDEIFLELAIHLMKETLQWQIISDKPEYHGAFPASRPSYGSYFPFQYVNWTNKFFLDACYQMKKFL